MKRLKKISYLYFAVGLILCLHSLISQERQTLNIDDTYIVILPNDFAFLVTIIFVIIGFCFIIIEKYIRYIFQLVQFLMFCIPFIYYVFSDLINHNNPGYYLANPIAFKWEVAYIPVTLYLCFLTSIITFIGFLIFSIIKKWPVPKSHFP